MTNNEKLKAIRLELGMSQRDLAEKSPYEKSYISLMENGSHPVTKEMVNALKIILHEKLKKMKIMLDNLSK